MRGLALVAGVLVAATCAAPGAGPRTSGDFDPRWLGGPCPYDHVDGPDAGSYVTQPGVWFAVSSLDLASGGRRHGTNTYRAGLTRRGGDDVDLPAEMSELRMHSESAEKAAAALDSGAEVVVHFRNDPQPRTVAFALAFHGDEFAFLGGCEYRFTEWARGLLGPDAAAELRALVGKPRTVTRLVLDLPYGFPPAVLLAEDEAARAGMRTGRLAVEAPDGWTVPFRICAGTSRGWGGCVDLSTAHRRPARLWFLPDGSERVGVWVMERSGPLDYPVNDAALLVSGDALAKRGDEPVELRVRITRPLGEADVRAGQVELVGPRTEFEVRRA